MKPRIGKAMFGKDRRHRVATLLLAAGLAVGLATAEEPTPLYGARGVSPLAVRQGVLGTCYFHASIAELAKVSPETLRGAISENPSGGYRVRFVSGPEETVFAEDIEYGRAHSYDHSEGNWVLVLMRGYAQRALRLSLVKAIQQSPLIPVFVKPMALVWLDQSGPLLVAYDRAIRMAVDQNGEVDKAALKRKLAAQLNAIGIAPEEAKAFAGFLDEKGFFDSVALTVRQNGEVFGAYKTLGQGGIPVRVIEAFLGAADAGQVADRKSFLERLRKLPMGGTAIVAGTRAEAPRADFESQNKDWWVSSHAYSVLDYDEAAATVTLRNPWGARPSPDGVFTIPLAVFLESFEGYSYSHSATP